MPTRNINLTNRYDRFVADQISAGRFRNASEVMRAGLHLLEQQSCEEQAKLAMLRALAAEGFDQIDQGLGIEIESREQLADHIAGIGRRAARRARARKSSE